MLLQLWCRMNHAWLAFSGKLELQILAFADAICDSTDPEGDARMSSRFKAIPVGQIRGKA